MKKYNVENRMTVADMYDNYLGDYVEAETAEEAKEIAKCCLKEKVVENGADAYFTYFLSTNYMVVDAEDNDVEPMDYEEWLNAEIEKLDICDYKVICTETGEVEYF